MPTDNELREKVAVLRSRMDQFETYVTNANRDREAFHREMRDALVAINREMHDSFTGFNKHLGDQDTKFGKAWGAIVVMQVVVLPILWLFLKK